MNRNELHDFRVYLASKNYSKRTIDSYSSCLIKFLDYYKKTPRNITAQEIREYLSKVSYSLNKQTVGALRHYFKMSGLKSNLNIEYPRKPKRLPVVYSREEVSRIINAIDNIKHRAIIELIYSSGLRISEAVNLKIADIDSDRMTVFVRGAKGYKDRYTCLSEKTLETLRGYYLVCRPKVYLFEGVDGKYSVTSIRNVFNRAKSRVRVFRGTVHTLRHSFATHCLESGMPTIILQKQLGHNSSRTTEGYTLLAMTNHFKSPY